MKTYLIGYDLNEEDQDYDTLIEKIKEIGNWWHCLDSTWIVKCDNTAVEIRNFLKQFIDTNDKLLVVHLSGEAAWTGFSDECSQWLKNNL